MNAMADPKSVAKGRASIQGYYQFHSKIYDATRWTFLFGRTAILREIASACAPLRILEVGCGTGKNLVNLCRMFPGAMVTGIDLSETMLDLSRRKTEPFGERVRLIHGAYGPNFETADHYDVILFSYALTMFNPGFDEAIETAHRHLVEGGHIAVVDFHDTRISLFERWMGVNHVRMNGQLRPLLNANFSACKDRQYSAYGLAWRYLIYLGRKSRDMGSENLK